MCLSFLLLIGRTFTCNFLECDRPMQKIDKTLLRTRSKSFLR